MRSRRSFAQKGKSCQRIFQVSRRGGREEGISNFELRIADLFLDFGFGVKNRRPESQITNPKFKNKSAIRNSKSEIPSSLLSGRPDSICVRSWMSGLQLRHDTEHGSHRRQRWAE
jgi:hypothetical protein